MDEIYMKNVLFKLLIRFLQQILWALGRDDEKGSPSIVQYLRFETNKYRHLKQIKVHIVQLDHDRWIWNKLDASLPVKQTAFIIKD